MNVAAEWTNNNDMEMNSYKSKEMIISYARGNLGNEVTNIIIEGRVVGRVDHVKLLGITLSNDLTWKRHVDTIVKKAGKNIMLYQLKRAVVGRIGENMFTSGRKCNFFHVIAQYDANMLAMLCTYPLHYRC